MGNSRALRYASAFTAALTLTACERDTRPDQWDAFLYNESMDGSVKQYTLDGFKTLEQCRAAAQRVLIFHGKGESQDYECGYKCGYHPGYGLSVCEETAK